MPWIDREVLTELRADNAWLRAQLEQAYRHQRAVERVERKLPEREPEPRKPPEEIPGEILKLVRIHPEEAQEALVAEIRKARQLDPPLTWQEIDMGIRARLPRPLLERIDHPEGQ